MPDLLLALGRRLARARTEMGLTQEQAASAVGISREELSYYENGRREISLGRLAELACLYGYDLRYFLSDATPGSEAPVAVAFRADSVSSDDLEIISWAKKLVMEAHELDALLKGGES